MCQFSISFYSEAQIEFLNTRPAFKAELSVCVTAASAKKGFGDRAVLINSSYAVLAEINISRNIIRGIRKLSFHMALLPSELIRFGGLPKMKLTAN
jgi:hypothetical protein